MKSLLALLFLALALPCRAETPPAFASDHAVSGPTGDDYRSTIAALK